MLILRIGLLLCGTDLRSYFLEPQSMAQLLTCGPLVASLPSSCMQSLSYPEKMSLPTYEASHEFQTKKKRQLQRQNEEMAKTQKLQHPGRLPPIQHSGQTHPQHWNNPGHHPINNNPQLPMPGVTTHHQYGKPRGPAGVGGGPSGRYPPVLAIIKTVGCILRRVGHCPTLGIAPLRIVDPAGMSVDMEVRLLLVIHKMVSMELLVAGVRIHRPVIETSSMVGSNSSLDYG